MRLGRNIDCMSISMQPGKTGNYHYNGYGSSYRNYNDDISTWEYKSNPCTFKVSQETIKFTLMRLDETQRETI